MLFVLFVRADIYVAIWVNLVACPLLLVMAKPALVYPSVSIKWYAHSMLSMVYDLAEVYAMLTLNQTYIRRIYELIDGCAEKIGSWITHKEFLQLFECVCPNVSEAWLLLVCP